MNDVPQNNIDEPVDFETLWSTVQGALQLFAGARWAERGEHDPGITLLQALTFNVADLSFRQSLPLSDLLTPQETAEEKDAFDVQRHPQRDGIFAPEFGPERALTCGPVTYEDYRRAILDLVVEISGHSRYCFRDVQITREDDPALLPSDTRYRYRYGVPPSHPERNTEKLTSAFTFVEQGSGQAPPDVQVVSGGYRIWLALASGVDERAANKVLLEFLRTNRNLCETFNTIEYLRDTPVQFYLTIDLDDDVVDFSALLAQIYVACTTVLLPPVKRRNAAQRLDEEAAEDVYLGPQLQHGWIDALPPLVQDWKKREQPLESLRIAIEAVAGVNQLARISTSSETVEREFSVAVQTRPVPWGSLGDYPAIAQALCKNVILRKRGRLVHMEARSSEVTTALKALFDPFQAQKPEESRHLAYGQHREPGAYGGTSTLLPALYRTQVESSQLTPETHQLLQFLLPFDQCLADEMDQLRKLPWLLSFDRRDPQARVRGGRWPVFDKDERLETQIESVLSSQGVDELQKFVARYATDADKELEILDYLLHFFGEVRTKRTLFLAEMASAASKSAASKEVQDFRVVQQGYLRLITTLAYKRASIQIDHVSALQHRLAARLGIGATLFEKGINFDALPFYLIEHRQLLPVAPTDALLAQAWKHVLAADVVGPQGSNYLLLALELGKGLQSGQLIELRKGNAKPIVANVIHDACDVGDFQHLDGLQRSDWKDISSKIKTLSEENKIRIVSIDLAQHDRLQWNATSLVNDLNKRPREWKWQASKVWLKRVVYLLEFVDDQRQRETMPITRHLRVGPSFPPEWKVTLPQKITLKDRRTWQITAHETENDLKPPIQLTVKSGDPLQGILVVQLTDQNSTWPNLAQQLDYGWVVDYQKDVFSFTLSVVMQQHWLTGSKSDPQATDQWVRDIVRETVPAHIGAHVHWLGPSDFKNFASTYASWQRSGMPAGDLSYKLLRYLSIGELPADHRTGIGFVRIASPQQVEAFAATLKTSSGNNKINQADKAQVVYVKEKFSEPSEPPKY